MPIPLNEESKWLLRRIPYFESFNDEALATVAEEIEPVAIIVVKRDVNLVAGTMTADQLYGIRVPVISVDAEDFGGRQAGDGHLLARDEPGHRELAGVGLAREDADGAAKVLSWVVKSTVIFFISLIRLNMVMIIF